MESKLNHTSIEEFSTKYSAKVADPFFEKHDRINGEQILNFCNLKQINLFILKNLFLEWQSELKKLKSPYFNYEAEEVKSVMTNFMNVLSKNISIDRANFEELLVNAIKDTILLIFSPYDFYRHFVGKHNGSYVTLEGLKKINKYIQINKHLHEGLIEKFEKEKVREVSIDEALTFLDIVCSELNAAPEDFENYLAQFSDVEPLTIEMIYSEEPEESIAESVSYEKSGDENQEDENGASNVNEKFSKEIKTLHDEIKIEAKQTIADIHQNKKIESIKKNITINQRFMFVNELFGGDSDHFNQALEALEVCDSYDSAMKILNESYAKEHDWNMDSEEVCEFIDILSKRYNA
ncbi:hypothetical protein QQ008_18245 [Fulvivirgaceae bacterium BMA10]|uniref:Uncharacterized protein n=1 Tax=Splendidivirga corallicola TaxID=3051826 RepID=A0ABT8KT22_9BACT|nr:hypothetical protein [Fulvivirgaceae bacterium BMA10]